MFFDDRDIARLNIYYSNGYNEVYDNVASIQQVEPGLIRFITKGGSIHIINMKHVMQLFVIYHEQKE